MRFICVTKWKNWDLVLCFYHGVVWAESAIQWCSKFIYRFICLFFDFCILLFCIRIAQTPWQLLCVCVLLPRCYIGIHAGYFPVPPQRVWRHVQETGLRRLQAEPPRGHGKDGLEPRLLRQRALGEDPQVGFRGPIVGDDRQVKLLSKGNNSIPVNKWNLFKIYE